MKTSSIVVACLAVTLAGAQAQVASTVPSASQSTVTTPALPAPTPYRVVEQGENHRIWQWETYEPGPKSQVMSHIHKVHELATGLNHAVNGQWVASKEEIVILSDGTAAATQGQHQVYFPSDIYQGVIRAVTPSGQQLQSRPVALAFDDGTSTVLIAVLTNSVGQVVGTNQVIYQNAFEGVNADIVFSYRKGSFEQDIVLRGQPPSPASLNLNPATTRLQVLTEFINPPTPIQQPVAAGTGADTTDTTLEFSSVTFGHGKAFLIGNAAQNRAIKPAAQVPVYKTWLKLQGRTFLIEAVPYQRITKQLQALPLSASAASKVNFGEYALRDVSGQYPLPPAHLVQASTNKFQIATADTINRTGVVLDYVQITTAKTNFTFQGDTTYYVSGNYNLIGTTTIEAGSVIKFNGSGQLDIAANGSIKCATGPYQPAVFTSVNDNTVGEAFGSGSPAFGDVNMFLNINSTNVSVHDLRFSYCYYCVNQNPTQATLDVWDCQFNNVDIAIFGGTVGVHNVLIARSYNEGNGAVDFSGATMIGENVTADFGTGFVESENPGGTVSLTNCLVTRQPVMSIYSYSVTSKTNSLVCLLSPSVPVYQTVGAGSYYLTNASPYHSYGTMNINPTLLGQLRQKTTYPPVVYSNVAITVATTFTPQAYRDTSSYLDLGYHYDPIDYFFSGVSVSSNLTFSVGTAVGWFELPGSGGAGYGLGLANGITVAYTGTATQPCEFARYDVVQEGGNGLWTDEGWLGGMANVDGNVPSNPPHIVAKFTHFSRLNSGNHFRDGVSGQPINVQATHCEFLNAFGGYNLQLAFTNCLFDRANVWEGTSEIYPFEIYRDCTFHGGSLGFTHWESGAPYWYTLVHDCAFDGTTFAVDHPFGYNTTYADYNYNSFLQGTNVLPVAGANFVTVTNSYNWQTSWFGNYYQAANYPLVDQGSMTADQLGLYHFTQQTNQVKEVNSTVDIGYHYVATDAYGNPIDSNGNGIPDYLEDGNGNGITDVGESPFGITIENPINGSMLY